MIFKAWRKEIVRTHYAQEKMRYTSDEWLKLEVRQWVMTILYIFTPALTMAIGLNLLNTPVGLNLAIIIPVCFFAYLLPIFNLIFGSKKLVDEILHEEAEKIVIDTTATYEKPSRKGLSK